MRSHRRDSVYRDSGKDADHPNPQRVEPMNMAVAPPSVVTYRDEYREAFAELNREWIERHFRMEPRDREALQDPRGTIVEPGGQVFFAVAGGEVMGTVAMKRAAADVFELSKMAVRPEARGRGYGDLLVGAAVAWARERGARRVFLLSNTLLAPAIRLYEKHGFVTEHRGPHPGYERANIRMELDLTGGAPPGGG